MSNWVFAALLPSAVAPHPNYFSEESEDLSPQQALAILMSARFSDFVRLERADGWAQRWSEDERALVLNARRSMESETQLDGARELRRLVLHDDVGHGFETVAAVISSSALLDADEIDESISVLRFVLDRTPNERRLDRAWLQLLLASRLCDRVSWAGAKSQLIAARSEVEEIGPNDVPSMRLTRALSWTPEQALQIVREGLADSIEVNLRSLNSGLDFDSDVRFLGRAPVRYWATYKDAIASGLELRQEGDFERRIRDAHSSTIRHRWGVSDAPGFKLFYAHLQAETSGDWVRSLRTRKLLGRDRLLNSSVYDEQWAAAESLRLLRRSRDYEATASAADAIRESGPVAVLIQEARSAIGRIDRNLLRCDLEIIHSAADCLLPQDRAKAIGRLLPYVEDEVIRGPGNSWWSPVDRVWRTVADLLPAPGISRDVSRAARLVYAKASDRSESAPLGWVLTQVDWAEIPEEFSWWDQRLASDVANNKDEVASTLARTFSDLGSSKIADALTERLVDSPNLATVEKFLTSRDSSELAPLTADAIKSLTRGVRAVTEDARRHSYGFGGSDVTDMAAYVLLNIRDSDLEDAVSELLLEPLVARQDKAAAFRRFGPGSGVSRKLSEATGRAAFMDLQNKHDSGAPFTSMPGLGLRYLLVSGAMSWDEGVVHVMRLMASGDAIARRAVARIILPPAAGVQVPWATRVLLASRLVDDQSSTVRHDGAQLLAECANSMPDGALYDETVRLLREILSRDGIAIPLGVLEGLEIQMNSPLRPLVSALVNHPAAVVSDLARQVLAD